MALIRIVDHWRRSPVSAPAQQRAILVVAETWSEQRVLMRAFASSVDQTQPTISLYGATLTISPAGLDPHGPWGIHVNPPGDGRAQELLGELELAARRLAGSKGNPPRLADEASSFERKPTNQWAPLKSPADHARTGVYQRSEAAANLPVAQPGTPYIVPTPHQPAQKRSGRSHAMRVTPVPGSIRTEAAARSRRQTRTTHGGVTGVKLAQANPGSSTAFGYSHPGAPVSASAIPAKAPVRSLASAVGHTMPLGFHLSAKEREVLNTLGRRSVLTASEVAEITGETTGMGFMERLMNKLEQHHLELVAPGQPQGGEPTYVLRR